MLCVSENTGYYAVASMYRVTPKPLAGARDSMFVLHSLPRVDEIDHRVDARPHARDFQQARNGVPIWMTILLEAMG